MLFSLQTNVTVANTSVRPINKVKDFNLATRSKICFGGNKNYHEIHSSQDILV